LVELQVTAARIREGAHDLAIGRPEIAIEIVHRWIDRFRHPLAAIAEMQTRRRRDRHLGRRLGVPGKESEMPDHRVTRKPAELALEPQQNRPWLQPLELELALAVVRFDAVEPDQEIGLPGGAAIFTSGDGVEADLFLFADQLGDLLVL